MYPQYGKQPSTAALAQTTVREYLRALRLIAANNEEPFESLVSKSRARVIKAAVHWCVEQVKRPDIAKNPLAQEFYKVLRKLGGPTKALELIDGIDITSLKRRVGRVGKLRGLDPDWAMHLVEATMKESPIEHAAVIALFLTGCRISELRGMKICIRSDAIGIVISGKKLKANAGQEVRKLAYRKHGVAAVLAGLCPGDGTLIQLFKDLPIRRIAHVIEKASQKTQGSPYRVNSSCLRNNVASISKAAGWEPSKIAALLGHQSEATQQAYGRAVLGLKCRGWLEPIKVQATTPTRAAGAKPFSQGPSESESAPRPSGC